MKAKIVKQHVGTDSAKDDFKACFMQRKDDGSISVKASRTFKNTYVGYKAFVAWVLSKTCKELPVSFSMEATGVYHENLAHFLNDSGYQVHVLLAQQVKNYAKSLNIKTKTDDSDAQCIAQMGLERNLKPWKPFSPNMRKLKQLTRERSTMLKEKTALTNKLHAFDHSYCPDKDVIKLTKERIKLIDKQMPIIEAKIKQTIKEDSLLKEGIKKVCAVRGFGLTSVAIIVAETNGFEYFTSQSQLTSYAGYDVVERKSGTSIHGKSRISKKGNAHIRMALHFPALTAIIHEPAFKAVFDRVFERSRVKMKGVVAVQRKLLLMAYTLFKNNIVFDPEYHKNLNAEKENSRQDISPAYTE